MISVSQKEKDKYNMVSLTISYHRNRLTDIQSRLVEWEVGVSGCKLLYIHWVNKVLLYSTGNYIQYPVINHNRKNMKKMYIHIYN